MTDAMLKFSDKLCEFENALSDIKLSLLKDKAESVAFVCVDMIGAFCVQGALSSPECKALSNRVANTLKDAKELGFKHFLFLQDRHSEDSTEFDCFPPHAVKNTQEADMIEQIKELNLDQKIFYKNSFSIAYNENFKNFIDQNPQIDTFIVIGNCTDICIFNTISHLRCSANEQNIKRNIILVSDLVSTFTTMWHDSRLFNTMFLFFAKDTYGVEIYKNLL
ncbi:isochorismatase family cysteine hydrolase [Campylobacter mucosalis]|uniref:Pyrazinamidase / nicotinamidase n=1 Tax=Campylobacter mucosalis CCUG 21559 TaxID=1032067 RepID=A0A6G5QF54_9BACT|nr:isochorismatase family cysteine hydrolase [Campylobacter mucosalis]QCD44197.1 pyrazinamidase / nicotinamidase [Campylobacter mucosalis CCUG 21559]QKF63600.1 pyrazinamidase / nicotinamidase [Campylobacter mucosalis]